MKVRVADIEYGVLTIVYYFSMLLPPYIEYAVPWVTSICDMIKIMFFLFLVLRNVFINRRLSPIVILAFIYAMIPAAVTFINGGKYVSVIRNIVVLPSTIMWCDYLKEKCSHIVINSLTFLLECLIYINLLTIIFVPDGLYLFEPIEGTISNRVWFLGYRTGHNIYLIFGCICGYIRYLYSKRRFFDWIRLIALFIASITTVIFIGTGTGYVVITAFILSMLFCTFSKKIRMKFSWAVIFHVILFFAISAFSASEFFAGYFNLFGKSTTMTGRTDIWAATWLRVIQSPIFGYGYMNDSDLLWLRLLASGATTSHNAFMDMLFRGGIVTFILFIVILVVAGRQLEKNKLSLHFNNVLICLYICMFFVMQSESGMDSVILFTMIGLITVLPDAGSTDWNIKRTGALYENI